ncbi:hypothetical protein [Mucilaginibacter lappiensis]|uniref:Membrane protein YphA (DoxX/SURF4 family) n=1 Tax=Mucilaginibacter lappiensis TaxID=354630 RepID=A0A1N7BS54_9SPHI|nr:hypothetical protein [Mucilaginibacter lappiensis]MBB6110057.1 putative membrane protein YphA (DoxX/SURF4 family) [Mucilaginibacter lappiensis]MBB6126765.1 putative membrane protein YphA (DoxX/SURF4 family) [Mucilaginibacter lappiensis]SIR54219.1 hypothetical protein SAMN05421821_108136 [Mucilaginibacter lappiensis]
MNNNLYLNIGKFFLVISIIAIGAVHIVSGHFPAGLMPVVASLPAKQALAYLTGLLLIVAGLLVLIKKYAAYGAFLAALLYLLALLLIHVPKVLAEPKNPSEWAGFFEIICIMGGTLILLGATSKDSGTKLIKTGTYLFSIGLLVFGVQHYMYAQFVANLIPAWIPARLFWDYLVMVAFFASAISFIIQRLTHLAGALLGLMFLIWVLILHLPRVIASIHTEPEWTSLFVALAFSGISFLIAGLAPTTRSKSQ